MIRRINEEEWNNLIYKKQKEAISLFNYAHDRFVPDAKVILIEASDGLFMVSPDEIEMAQVDKYGCKMVIPDKLHRIIGGIVTSKWRDNWITENESKKESK